MTIRTLDAGGDKPIAGPHARGESNPFLGLRGIRLSLARPDVFRVQLRALCRAAAHGAVEVMLPMVTRAATSSTRARGAARRGAAPSSRPRASPRAGRRSASWSRCRPPRSRRTLFDADFFSIGSNDLTQYVMAAARDSDAVAALDDPGIPAVLRLIARRRGAWRARAAARSACAATPAAIRAWSSAAARRPARALGRAGRRRRASRRRSPRRSAARSMTDDADAATRRSDDPSRRTRRILRDVLDQRPSGTRQRLANALGKNRSFVSQISNPAYPAPIPAPHLEIIFEICHFSPARRTAFLEAFDRAHPNR